MILDFFFHVVYVTNGYKNGILIKEVACYMIGLPNVINQK